MRGLNQVLLAAFFCVSTLGLSMAWQPSVARAQWGSYGYPYGQPWGGSGFSLNVGPGGYITFYRSGYLGPSYYPYYRSGYGSYYGNGLGYGSYYGSYYGGGYGSYYGNGAHDYQPHWHSTQTPYGAYNWYGNGPHDAVPHQHAATPYGFHSHSQTQAGPTTSFNGVPAY